MNKPPISGRKLLEAAKRVRARRQLDGNEGAEVGTGRLPSDAELLAMIEAEALERKEAHRERMRRYYRERNGTEGATASPAGAGAARTRPAPTRA